MFRMPRIVDRGYLADLLNRCCCHQEANCFFSFTPNCIYCKKSVIVEEELQKKKKKLIALIQMSFFIK